MATGTVKFFNNEKGYGFISRHTDELSSPDDLLAELGKETSFIRTWSLGALFVEALGKAQRVPAVGVHGLAEQRRVS